MNRFISTATLCACAAVSGCSTHLESVKYTPSSGSMSIVGPPITSPVGVGNFTDNRGTDPRWLGAIRGGYGNVLKRIESDKPSTEVVHDGFVAALEARKIPTSGSSPVMIEGSITKMDCSYFFNKEFHAHFHVTVASMPTRAVVFQQDYVTDRDEPGSGAGIFGDPDALAREEQDTINATIDKAFADAGFLAAISGANANRASNEFGNSAPIDERIKKLDELHAKGLITDDEYTAKKKALLDSL
jgi:Short C-terminal domain